jgi:pyrrolidone-carboxylate peptidase
MSSIDAMPRHASIARNPSTAAISQFSAINICMGTIAAITLPVSPNRARFERAVQKVRKDQATGISSTGISSSGGA